MGEKAVIGENSQTELQLLEAASCWLFVEMQVEVDNLCHCLSQWPNSVFSLKEALAPVFYAASDPEAGGDFGKCGHSSLTKQEHPLIFPPTGPMFSILRA